MYTAVLMVALSAGNVAPEWGGLFRGGCHGYGHSHVCGGYACSCLGSYGGGHGHGYGYGCGCYGYACGGYGCAGAYGWGGYGYNSVYGGMLVCNGCYGCYGGWSCYGSPIISSENLVVPGTTIVNPVQETPAPTPPPAPAPSVTPAPKAAPAPAPSPNFKDPIFSPPGDAKSAPVPAPAPGKEQARVRSQVIIEVPEDAKLYVDGQLMRTTSSRRVFRTPELNPGSNYFYDLRVEVERDGKIHTESRRIHIRPGQEAIASFQDRSAQPGIVTAGSGQD